MWHVKTYEEGSFDYSYSDDAERSTYEEKTKRALTNWAHTVKGMHLDESVFFDNNKMLYSEFLQENADGIFPWSSSDFDDGEPTRHLESMYNVSPVLFPTNFFMDVIKAKTFKYIIPVLIRCPIGRGLGNGFQGNIKFKLTEV